MAKTILGGIGSLFGKKKKTAATAATETPAGATGPRVTQLTGAASISPRRRRVPAIGSILSDRLGG